jgi:hypothetical protein
VKYKDIHPTLRTVLGAHEGFRKLDFPAETIFLQTGRSALRGGVLSCFAVLRTQLKEFSIECGDVPKGDESAFLRDYQRTVAAVRCGAFPQEDLDRIWQESDCHTRALAFAVALVNKGFVPPGKNW